MKKKNRTVLFALGAAVCISLCGCGEDAKEPYGEPGGGGEKEPTATEAPARPTAAPDIIDPDIDVQVTDLDYSSEEALLGFVSGEWVLADKKSGEDMGVLTIAPDGSCEYRRAGAGSSCSGKLGFTQDYGKHTKGADWYTLDMEALPQEYSGGSDISESSSSGYFHIAQTIGQDYLYLEEAGNGASEVVYCVFGTADEYEVDTKWVFHRENEVTEIPGSVKQDQFFAMLWTNDENGLLLQRMDAVNFDTESEYTGYKYVGAVFTEAEYPEAVWYDLSDRADLSAMLDGKRFSEPYPAKIYAFYTDANGAVSRIADVREAGYGEYELAGRGQDISYEGRTFRCNGREYSLDELGVIGTNINGCEVVGDYAVIEAHINPHRSSYTIFDLRGAWPLESVVAGDLLIGRGIWDYFTSDMNSVCDREGNVIHLVDGTEIVGLSFTEDEEHIKVEYWKDDYETVYEDIIERPVSLNAPVYAFAEYRRQGTAAAWADFVKLAPEDALFMVMVNPPSDDAWDFYQPKAIEGGGLDTVYVVSLRDGTEFSFGTGDSVTLDKGGLEAYSLTVPEGGIRLTLSAVTADGRKAEWPVTMISGKDAVCWDFGVAE